MDAFLSYLIDKGKIKDRLFVSNPPYPALLVWSDFTNLQKVSGITLVHMENSVTEFSLDYKIILSIIKNRISHLVPVLDILYSDDINRFIIEDKTFSNKEAANYISETLKIKLGKNPAKKPNNPKQINDPFHIWSRDVFDGISVRKIDIDAVIVNEKRDKITTIIEVKRSAKIKVGKWLPYISLDVPNTDYWNYIMAFSLCKMLTCNFLTFHHEILEGNLTDETKVDVFEFNSNTLISSETINFFGSNNNRKVIKAKILT
jgi:hypothetical protein